MSEPRSGPAGYVALAVLLAGLLAAVGWVPTRRLAGATGTTAMLAGIAVSLAVSLVAMLPVVWARATGAGASGRGKALLWSSLLRFVGALLATLVVVMSGWVARGPFLLWVGLSYLALLVADSAFAVAALRGAAPDRKQNIGD